MVAREEQEPEARFREEPGKLLIVVSLDELKMLSKMSNSLRGKWLGRKLVEYMRLRVKDMRKKRGAE